MASDVLERSARRPLDEGALRRVVRRLQAAPAAPWLHEEVGRRMAERLPVIRLQPSVVAQWWAHLGASGPMLERAYPRARQLRVEPDAAPCDDGATARPWWSPSRWAAPKAQVLAESSLAAGAAQLLWANMGLHWAPDPQAVLRRWHQVLQVDGFLMFSTLGPGSLAGLRDLYLAQGWPAPHAPFVDMHDLGDMLVEAGFADPVMDQEELTLTWSAPAAALAELRQLGGNVDPRRHPGLRTPRWRQRLEALLDERRGADGRIALGFEIVYGHAFRPPPRARLEAETRVPLADLRALVRAGRRQAGWPNPVG
jgi:malonyl-CoA O-methyltransferase